LENAEDTDADEISLRTIAFFGTGTYK